MTWRQWTREHPATAWLACGLVVTSVVAGAVWSNAAGVSAEADRLRAEVERMEQMAAEYRQWKSPGGVAASRGEPLSLGAVERIARESRIDSALTDRSAAPLRGSDGSVEQTVRLSVAGVAPGALSAFLFNVEKLNPSVRVRELRVAANRKQTGMIDASVVIAAYETSPSK